MLFFASANGQAPLHPSLLPACMAHAFLGLVRFGEIVSRVSLECMHASISFLETCLQRLCSLLVSEAQISTWDAGNDVGLSSRAYVPRMCRFVPPIEIRKYAPYLIAEVEFDEGAGDMRTVLSSGFRQVWTARGALLSLEYDEHPMYGCQIGTKNRILHRTGHGAYGLRFFQGRGYRFRQVV
jgi:hypothetical protein